MRHTWLHAALIFAAGMVHAQAVESSGLTQAMMQMPSEIQAGTFDQLAFEDSLERAVIDTNLDLPAVNRYLASEIESSDVRVRRYAALVFSQLASRRANSAEELKPVLPKIVASVDDEDEGVRNGIVVTITRLQPAVPDSVVVPLRQRLEGKDIDRSSYAELAAELARIRPNDSATDSVLIAFLRSPKISDPVRAEAIRDMRFAPLLSDLLIFEIGMLLRSTASNEVKLASITAIEQVGPRAINSNRGTLVALHADPHEDAAIRQAASDALKGERH